MTDLYSWQQSLWQQFASLKQQQRIPHAILLTGVDGLAKNAFSQHITKSVLCLSPHDSQQACGQCHSCQVFDAGSHPDHIEIKPEEIGKQIKIEQIRQLIEKQQLTPTVSKWKTVVISPAYSMNVNANNSLLKLLEEPQQNTLFVLITSKPEQTPITVKSRCQTFHMATPAFSDALTWLENNSSYNADDITTKILKLAKGAPLAAIDILNEQGSETYQQIEQDFNAMLTAYISPIELAANWQKYNLSQLMNQLQYSLQDRIVNNQLVTDKPASLEHQSKRYWQIMDCIVDTTKLLSSPNNLNKALLIEDFIVTVMRLSDNAQ